MSDPKFEQPKARCLAGGCLEIDDAIEFDGCRLVFLREVVEEVEEEEEEEDEEEEEEEEEGNVGILKMDNGAGCSFCSWLAAVDCRCDVGIKL